MITGYVTPNREAVIHLSVLDSQGQSHDIEAIIDTGFNGFLTLPPQMAADLGLEFQGHGYSTLANGQQETFKLYAATVLLDGQLREIVVDAADVDALVGMALLEGFALHLQITNGGAVTLELLPAVG